jgi:hypothetical protein
VQDPVDQKVSRVHTLRRRYTSPGSVPDGWPIPTIRKVVCQVVSFTDIRVVQIYSSETFVCGDDVVNAEYQTDRTLSEARVACWFPHTRSQHIVVRFWKTLIIRGFPAAAICNSVSYRRRLRAGTFRPGQVGQYMPFRVFNVVGRPAVLELVRRFVDLLDIPSSSRPVAMLS